MAWNALVGCDEDADAGTGDADANAVATTAMARNSRTTPPGLGAREEKGQARNAPPPQSDGSDVATRHRWICAERGCLTTYRYVS